MSRMSAPFRTCRNCGTILLGDREPAAGICGTCATPTALRVRRRPRRKRAPRVYKALTYTCRGCGAEGERTVMGRPRVWCPACARRR
jgi:hypothetical protein